MSYFKNNFIDYENNHEFYEQKEKSIQRLLRKGKKLPFKKRKLRKMKKSNIKSNGFDNKLLNFEVNIPDLFDELYKKYYETPKYEEFTPFVRAQLYFADRYSISLMENGVKLDPNVDFMSEALNAFKYKYYSGYY